MPIYLYIFIYLSSYMTCIRIYARTHIDLYIYIHLSMYIFSDIIPIFIYICTYVSLSLNIEIGEKLIIKVDTDFIT